MSKQIHRAPLALSSDGSVLLNIAMFDVRKSIEAMVALARSERGAVFIGVTVLPTELERLRDQIDDATMQAAFGLVGSRQARHPAREK